MNCELNLDVNRRKPNCVERSVTKAMQEEEIFLENEWQEGLRNASMIYIFTLAIIGGFSLKQILGGE
jgi:hypothetical protein